MNTGEKINELKAHIKRMGIGQVELAEMLKTSQPTLNAMINGKKPFGKKVAALWEEKFGISAAWLLTGEGSMLKNKALSTRAPGGEELIYVPLLPILAQGGSLNDFVVSVMNSECEQVVSPIKGADFAITVAGESMFPEYPSGSQILIKKINERAFIDWGKTYVLDTCNGTVIKRVFPSDTKDPSFVKCVSINPDYPPFEVNMEDVYGVYRVLMCMAVK
jgi:phage repressor protein C with HTH and peptisase S24 domain